LKDEGEDLQVELISRATRIKVSNALIAEFKKLGEAGVFTDSSAVRWLTDELPVQKTVGCEYWNNFVYLCVGRSRIIKTYKYHGKSNRTH
jgi:hypothetical protein